MTFALCVYVYVGEGVAESSNGRRRPDPRRTRSCRPRRGRTQLLPSKVTVRERPARWARGRNGDGGLVARRVLNPMNGSTAEVDVEEISAGPAIPGPTGVAACAANVFTFVVSGRPFAPVGMTQMQLRA